MEDLYLLEQIAFDDRAAFAAIYNKYWQDLFDGAYKRLKNPAQCEDILQEVFISVWSRRKELKVDDLNSYLHKAVRYRIYNYIKRDLVQEAFYEPFESIAEMADDNAAVEAEEELLHLLEAYVATLPKKQRQVFVLYFKERYTVAQIANEMGISPKTVQNHLSLALGGLRSRMLPIVILYCLYS